jgi:hypothetical protein
MQPLIQMLETLPDFKVCIKAFSQTLENPSQVLNDRRKEIALIENHSYPLCYRVFILLKLLLEDYVMLEQPIQRIADFASFLKPEVDAPFRQIIGTWLAKVQQQLGYQPIQVAKKGQKSQSLDAYLMIVIRKAQARANLFHANAFLMCEGEVEEWLEPGEGSAGPYTLKALPDQVSSFILTAERKLISLGNFTITVEVFLPIQYWCQEVDCWSIKLLSQKIPIGRKHRLSIRAYERISDVIGINDYQESAALRHELVQSWRELNDFLATNPEIDQIRNRIARIGREHTCMISTLEEQLSEGEKKISLKVVSCPPIQKVSKKQRERIFESAVVHGLPIIIWSRCEDTADGKLEKMVDGFLDQEGLSDFSKLLGRIKEKREKDKSSEGFGKHLVILCDNPDRLPTKPLPFAG